MKRGFSGMMPVVVIMGLVLAGCAAAQTAAPTLAAGGQAQRTVVVNSTPGQGGPGGQGAPQGTPDATFMAQRGTRGAGGAQGGPQDTLDATMMAQRGTRGAPGGQGGPQGTLDPTMMAQRGTRGAPGGQGTVAGGATATPAPSATTTPVPATKTATPGAAAWAKIASVTPGASGRIPLPDKPTLITFPQGANSYAVSTVLSGDQVVAYQLAASAGQTLHVAVTDVRVVNVQVFGPDANPLSQKVAMPGRLSVLLPQNGTYTVALNGLGEATLSLYLAGPNENPARGAPQPAVMQAVELPVMPYSISLPAQLEAGVPRGYSFKAQGGQALTLALSGHLTVTLIAPDGNTLVPEIDAFDHLWRIYLPETGTYEMIFLGSGAVSVTVKISAPPANPPSETKPGSAGLSLTQANRSTVFSTSFATGQEQTYQIHLESGQELRVNVTGSAGVAKFSSPADPSATLTHAAWGDLWSTIITQAGDYTVTLGGSGPSVVTFSLR